MTWTKTHPQIGIVGVGFVGWALMEGMKHAFAINAYDKVKGFWRHTYHQLTDPTKDEKIENPLYWLVRNTDGPIFVCLPTPMNKDGSCNTKLVYNVVNDLNLYSQILEKETVVAIKSTVPPGTCAELNERHKNLHICHNPEFLTERNSIDDFKNQDHILIGGPREGTNVLKQVYETAYPKVPVTKTSSTMCELVKYMKNCFLAVKVSFANEMQQVCEAKGEDYDKVVEYATRDERLGTSHWAVPGPDGKKGFGGSCFCKDLRSFMHEAFELGVETPTMKGAWDSNLSVRPEKDWEELKGRAVIE
jgi:UDPglucose 6-dehydrogenase